MKALALDFDGVISDSAAESFVVAVRTYAALRPASEVARLATGLAGAGGEQIQQHPVYRDFLALMPLGNRAEDFGVALAILEEGARVDDQAAYDACRTAAGEAFLEDFHDRFYREREALRGSDPAAWADLLAPYGPIVELLRRRAHDATLCIATAKDRPSVEHLLALYGIADLFPREHVVDKEHGRTKRAHVSTLQERLAVDFGEITFVDDKVNHLQDVSALGVRCALAAWGYNGARERTQARAAGHLVCSIDDVEPLLFGAPGPRC